MAKLYSAQESRLLAAELPMDACISDWGRISPENKIGTSQHDCTQDNTSAIRLCALAPASFVPALPAAGEVGSRPLRTLCGSGAMDISRHSKMLPPRRASHLSGPTMLRIVPSMSEGYVRRFMTSSERSGRLVRRTTPVGIIAFGWRSGLSRISAQSLSHHLSAALHLRPVLLRSLTWIERSS